MLSLPELIEHYQTLPAEQLDILVELRNLVAQIAPGATEEVRRQGLVYYWAERGGPVSAGICQILIQPDCIHLAFIHGSFLPDPAGLLRSDGRLVKRYVPIESYTNANAPLAHEIISQCKTLRDSKKILNEIVNEMTKNAQIIRFAADLILIINKLDRMLGHIENVAESVIFIVEGKIIKHPNLEPKKH